MDSSSDDRGLVEYAWDHAVISDEVYGAIKAECSFPEDGEESAKCNLAWNNLFAAMGDIDLYSLYTPACTKAMLNRTTSAERRRRFKLGTPLAVRAPVAYSVRLNSIGKFIFTHGVYIYIY